MRQRTVASITKAIRVLVGKGDYYRDRAGANSEKAEVFYARAGTELRCLKERKPKDVTWPVYVKAQCNLSQQRADELIRIADGRTTVDAVRSANAEAARKHRKAKSTLRNVEAAAPKRGEPVRLPQTVPGKGCDYDPTSQDQEQGEPYRITRARGYFASVKEAVRLAHENLMVVDNKADWALLDPAEITEKVIDAAQSAADAWLECVETLRRLKGVATNGNSQKKTALGALVH